MNSFTENNLLKIKGFCESSGIFRKDADEYDLKIIKKVKDYLKALKIKKLFFHVMKFFITLKGAIRLILISFSPKGHY